MFSQLSTSFHYYTVIIQPFHYGLKNAHNEIPKIVSGKKVVEHSLFQIVT
jgi:hypothetical protein